MTIPNKILLTAFVFIFPLTQVWGLAPQSDIEAVRQARDMSFESLQALFKLPPHEAEKLQPLLPRWPYVVFDFETTGLDPNVAKPIEIAALKFEGTKLVGKFHILIDPEEPLDPVVTDINGITDKMLRGQPSVKEGLTQFLEFAKRSILIGHNVEGLDKPMLERLIKELNLPYTPYKEGRQLNDTKLMAKSLIRRQEVGRYNLGNLARIARSPILPDHRAITDTIATATAYWFLKKISNSSFYSVYSMLEGGRDEFFKNLQKIYNYLQESSYVPLPSINYFPQNELVVFFANKKLEGIEELAKSYHWGGTRKILVVLNGAKVDRKTIKTRINQHKQKASQPPIPDEDLLVVQMPRNYEDKGPFLAAKIAEMGVKEGNVIIVSNPIYQKRRKLLFEKMRTRGSLPDKTTLFSKPISFLGTSNFGKELLRDDGKVKMSKTRWILNITLAALSEIENLRFYSELGIIEEPNFPRDVSLAYEYLRERTTPKLQVLMSAVEISL